MVIFLFLVNFASASYLVGGRAKININSMSPSPVEPGEYFDIYFQLQNVGSSTMEDLKIQFIDTNPFYVATSADRIKSLGDLGQNGLTYFTYRVRVGSAAISGDHELKLRIISGGFSEETSGINIRVQSRDALFDIAELKLDPDPIEPGKVSKLYLTLKNQESSAMYDVNVKLDFALSLLQTSLASTAASLNDEIPLVNVDGFEEKKVGFIEPGEKVTLEYNILAYPDADSRVYKIPLIITYNDALGTNYTKNNVIGLMVGSDPDLLLNVDSSDIYSRGGAGEITFSIINKGVTDVKFLTAILKETDDYEIISNSDVYIGGVDSDDYETVDYRIKLKTRSKKISLPLSLEYKDANNREYIEDYLVEFNIYSAAELGEPQASKAGLVVFIIIVIFAIYFVSYRRWRKRMKGKLISVSFMDYVGYTKRVFKKYLPRKKKSVRKK